MKNIVGGTIFWNIAGCAYFWGLMAYLRRENKKGQTYLSICESYRDKTGKVNRRTLNNLGNINKYTPEALERIGNQLIELVKPTLPEATIKELSRHNYGYPYIICRLLNIYGLDVLMRRFTRNHKLGFDLLQPLLLMLCDRFNDPASKLGSYNLQNDYIGIGKDIPLQHLYRSLDYLALHNELIQTHIYNKHTNLFNYELDVVFYDVTTFYFDSDVVQEGALRQKGFGKDGKIGKTQVLFSLLIDKNKVPIGFEIYKGSHYEGHTFKDAVKKLKSKYNIKRIIVVADSGMLNNDNIDIFGAGKEADGYEYIVGDRIKTLPEAVVTYLTDIKNYTTVKIEQSKETSGQKQSTDKDEDNDEALFLKYCTYNYKERTLICTWSAKRAKKDKAEREEKIKKAEQLIQKPSLLEKKSKRYFIKSTEEKKYELDQQKIEWQAKFDGFKAIATNAKGINAVTVLEKYKDLYKVEHSFRTFKSYLEARPMFHWTDTRIEGHLVLCYIAFCIQSYLQTQLGECCSEQVIRRALSKMELSKLQKENEICWLRSAMTPEGERIIKSLNLKQLPDVVSAAILTNYIPHNM